MPFLPHRSSVDEQPTVIGPLTAEKTQEKGAAVPYPFTYWARSGEKLEITPTSPVLLFYPPQASMSVLGGELETQT